MKWSTLRHRAYADFCMSPRLAEYRSLLETALAHGYEVCSLRRFRQKLEEGLAPDDRFLVLRHDVDTGVRTAADMFEIDREMGVKSSYYFRLRTLAVPLMRSIEAHGGEASYHFEELSTIAKSRRIRDRGEVPRILPLARELFARNLARLRQRTGLRMEIVASHGDWLNLRLGIWNSEILTSQSFRREVGIEMEAYDPELMKAVRKHSDGPYPHKWSWGDRDPADTIRAGNPAIHVLVHPRHWQVERFVNLLDNTRRLGEEVWYRAAR